MRLIDADALKKIIHCAYSDDLEILDKIDNAPTVEERPHGKWIRYRNNPHQPEHIKCSNCGQHWSVADHDKIFDICFKCGADMRKGGAE